MMSFAISRMGSTLDCSSAPAWMVPAEPVLASRRFSVPEVSDARKTLPESSSSPLALAKVATASLKTRWLCPLENWAET